MPRSRRLPPPGSPVSACSRSLAAAPSATRAAAVVGAGNVSAFEMQVGDCFDDPTDAEAQVSSLSAVPCESPTTTRSSRCSSMPRRATRPTPASRTLLDYSSEACVAPFAPFVGKIYAESHFVISALFPSSESWDQGDREVVCFLYDLTLEPWDGTAEGRAE